MTAGMKERIMDRTELKNDFTFNRDMSTWEIFLNLYRLIHSFAPEESMSWNNDQVIYWVARNR